MFGKVDVSDDRSWFWFNVKWYGFLAVQSAAVVGIAYTVWSWCT